MIKKKKESKNLAKEIKNTSENTLAEPIRNLKDSLRKIKRFELKSNDIVEERNDDLNKTICHSIWIFVKYIILLLVFLMVLFSDFIIPLISYSKAIEDNNATNITNTTDTITTDITDNDNSNLKHRNLNTPSRYAEEIFALLFLCIFNSAYTIILIYSINRRII